MKHLIYIIPLILLSCGKGKQTQTEVKTDSWLEKHSEIKIDTAELQDSVFNMVMRLSNYRIMAYKRYNFGLRLALNGNLNSAIKIEDWYNNVAIKRANKMVDSIRDIMSQYASNGQIPANNLEGDR